MSPVDEAVAEVEPTPEEPPPAAVEVAVVEAPELPEPVVVDEPVVIDLPAVVEQPAVDSAPEEQPQPAALPEVGPDPDARYAFDAVDQPPVALSTRLPAFDVKGRKAARGKQLNLEVLVKPSGRISSVQVVDGYADEALRGAAVGALLRWRFTGGSHRGVPVRVWVPVRLDFDIEGRELRAKVTSPGS